MTYNHGKYNQHGFECCNKPITALELKDGTRFQARENLLNWNTIGFHLHVIGQLNLFFWLAIVRSGQLLH